MYPSLYLIIIPLSLPLYNLRNFYALHLRLLKLLNSLLVQLPRLICICRLYIIIRSLILYYQCNTLYLAYLNLRCYQNNST